MDVPRVNTVIIRVVLHVLIHCMCKHRDPVVSLIAHIVFFIMAAD